MGEISIHKGWSALNCFWSELSREEVRADKHTWFRDAFASKGKKLFGACANRGHEGIQAAEEVSTHILGTTVNATS